MPTETPRSNVPRRQGRVNLVGVPTRLISPEAVAAERVFAEANRQQQREERDQKIDLAVARDGLHAEATRVLQEAELAALKEQDPGRVNSVYEETVGEQLQVMRGALQDPREIDMFDIAAENRITAHKMSLADHTFRLRRQLKVAAGVKLSEELVNASNTPNVALVEANLQSLRRQMADSVASGEDPAEAQRRFERVEDQIWARHMSYYVLQAQSNPEFWDVALQRLEHDDLGGMSSSMREATRKVLLDGRSDARFSVISVRMDQLDPGVLGQEGRELINRLHAGGSDGEPPVLQDTHWRQLSNKMAGIDRLDDDREAVERGSRLLELGIPPGVADPLYSRIIERNFDQFRNFSEEAQLSEFAVADLSKPRVADQTPTQGGYIGGGGESPYKDVPGEDPYSARVRLLAAGAVYTQKTGLIPQSVANAALTMAASSGVDEQITGLQALLNLAGMSSTNFDGIKRGTFGNPMWRRSLAFGRQLYGVNPSDLKKYRGEFAGWSLAKGTEKEERELRDSGGALDLSSFGQELLGGQLQTRLKPTDALRVVLDNEKKASDQTSAARSVAREGYRRIHQTEFGNGLARDAIQASFPPGMDLDLDNTPGIEGMLHYIRATAIENMVDNMDPELAYQQAAEELTLVKGYGPSKLHGYDEFTPYPLERYTAVVISPYTNQEVGHHPHLADLMLRVGHTANAKLDDPDLFAALQELNERPWFTTGEYTEFDAQLDAHLSDPSLPNPMDLALEDQNLLRSSLMEVPLMLAAHGLPQYAQRPVEKPSIEMVVQTWARIANARRIEEGKKALKIDDYWLKFNRGGGLFADGTAHAGHWDAEIEGDDLTVHGLRTTGPERTAELMASGVNYAVVARFESGTVGVLNGTSATGLRFGMTQNFVNRVLHYQPVGSQMTPEQAQAGLDEEINARRRRAEIRKSIGQPGMVPTAGIP